MVNTNYYLNKYKFQQILRLRGFSNVNEFVQSVKMHRNTVGQYLNQEKNVFAFAFEKICQKLEIDPLLIIRSGMVKAGPLNAVTLGELLKPLSDENPEIVFMLIGSRARGTAQLNSDWDIAISGGMHASTSNKYLEVKSKIEDLTEEFSQGCDVINLDAAPEWFFTEMEYQPQFLIGNYKSYSYILGLRDGIRKSRKDRESSHAA